MDTGQRYAKLVEIAKETSSEKRRDLLREITDMFFDSSEKTEIESHLFGELIAKIAFELDSEIRRELSHRFDCGSAPRPLALAFANDEIDVAYPILSTSKSLTDDDLVHIVAAKSTQYQLAVSQRPSVSEKVSDALVDHGDDTVVKSLLENEGANISDDTFEKVVIRAENNEELHGPIVNRKVVPPEVLNQLYMVVSGPMRQEILERNKNLSPEEVERAMARAQTRVGVINGTLPDDYVAMERKLKIIKASGAIQPQQLPNYWRSGEITLFFLAFADIVGVEYSIIKKIYDKKDADGIALLCRAKNFERGLFVALAVFALGADGMGGAEKLGKMYNEVPLEAAQRALRFMQVRNTASKEAA